MRWRDDTRTCKKKNGVFLYLSVSKKKPLLLITPWEKRVKRFTFMFRQKTVSCICKFKKLACNGRFKIIHPLGI